MWSMSMYHGDTFGSGEASRRVLIIEDHDELRELLADVLIDEGFAVTVARDGVDGIAKLAVADRLPHVIILDLQMPIMNGTKFLNCLAKDQKLKAIPVVLVTALPDPPELDVIATLAKPVDVEVLLSTLRTKLPVLEP